MSSVLKNPALPQHFHTVLKEAEKHSLATLKLLAHLVEETSDVLTAADADFKPITWNKASEKIYGLKAEEVRGRDLRNFIEVHYPHSTREKVVKLSGQKASGVSRPTS